MASDKIQPKTYFRFIFAATLVCFQSGLSQPLPSDVDGDSRSTFYKGAPVSNHTVTILSNTGYSVGYSDSVKCPLWASYRLFPIESPATHRRPSRFRIDTRTQSRISHKSYTRSGYSRGHMAPNYAIDTRYGREAQIQTFLMSNIIPQKQGLNGGVWRTLEGRIAKRYANEFEEVWVVTGPIFYPNSEPMSTGSGVIIPGACYKIVVDEVDGVPRMLGFIMRQTDRGDPARRLVSVDSIEAATGIDFFSGLEDRIENRVEAAVPTAMW